MAVANKKELLEQLTLHADRILALGVKHLAFFGSFARDEAREDSDVDFYVDFFEGKKGFDSFMDLADLLEEITGRRIELLTPESLGNHMGPHILKELEYAKLAA